jgi:hypothetical protein
MTLGSFTLGCAISPLMKWWELRPQHPPRCLPCLTLPHSGPKTFQWNVPMELIKIGRLDMGNSLLVEIWARLSHMLQMPSKMVLMTYCGYSMTTFKSWPSSMFSLFTRIDMASSSSQPQKTTVASFLTQLEIQFSSFLTKSRGKPD